MDAAYVEALQKKLDWAKFAKEAQANPYLLYSKPHELPETVFKVLPRYQEVLDNSQMIYMNGAFGELVGAARKTLPENSVFSFDSLPCPCGFMFLEKPLPIPDYIVGPDGVPEFVAATVQAIGWTRYTVVPTDRSKATYTGLFFITFTELSGHRGFLPWSYFTLEERQTVREKIEWFETKAVDGSYVPQYTKEMEAWRQHEIAWIFCAFSLMQQKLALNIEHRISRPFRRRAERSGNPLPPMIRLVLLRRMEQDRAAAGAAGQYVDWQWRWAVTGHWRTYENGKQVYVESYLKGPDDKPLKPPSHTIFLAKR